MTGKLYYGRILGKLNKYLKGRVERSCLLHDNALAHTSSVVTDCLETKKVTMLSFNPNQQTIDL